MEQIRITDVKSWTIEATPGRTWLFIEIHTNSPHVGLGEASQSRSDSGVRSLVADWTSRLVGQHPLEIIEPLRSRLLSSPFAGRLQYAAFSGIEQALWDLAGKAVGMPVYRLFGGALRDRVRLYATIDGATAEELAVKAESAVAQGFQAVKIYPFVFPDEARVPARAPLTQNHLRIAEGRIAHVRAAIGPNVELLADWAWRVSPPDARRAADAFEAHALYWIEEPFQGTGVEELRNLRSSIRPRLAGGEQLHGTRAFVPLLERRAVDVIMPDVKWVGGISEAKAISAMADAFDVEVAPHNMSGPVATAASLQFAVAARSLTFLEFCWEGPSWRNELVRGSEVLEEGHLLASDAPGLGIDWDPQVAAKLQR